MDSNLIKWANNLHKDNWAEVIELVNRNEATFANEGDMKRLFEIYNTAILPRGYGKQEYTCASCRETVHKHFKQIANYYAGQLGTRN